MKTTLNLLIASCLLTLSLSAKAGANERLEQLEKSLYPMLEQIENGVQRNVYEILKSYPSSHAKILTKWFKIASQVKNNKKIAFFIHKTDYKVGALLEIMLFSQKPVHDRDYEVLRSKFKFLSAFAQKDFIMDRKSCHTLTKLNFRTMPIVLNPTKKKTEQNRVKILAKKTDITLLYDVSYHINGKVANWGYIESDDRTGWVNLKYTSCTQ